MNTQNRMARFDRMAVIESQIQHRANLRKRANNLLDLDPSGSGNVIPAIRELIDVVDWRLIGKKLRSVVKKSQTWEGKDRHGRSQIKVISDTRKFFRKGPGRKGFAQDWFPLAAVPMREPHLYELVMDTGRVTIKKDDNGNPVSVPVLGFAYILYRDDSFFVAGSDKKLDAEEAHKKVMEAGMSHYRNNDPKRGPLMWGRTASITEAGDISLTHKNHTPKRRLPMRRSASEIIRHLEMRIARLEKSTRLPARKKASDIAATIIQQLGGGRKLQMMIGLKQLINEPLGVTLVFPLPKHKGAVNRVRITLNGLDLYDMEFIRYRAGKVKVVSTFNDVYAEDIKDRFEEGTGLYIRF